MTNNPSSLPKCPQCGAPVPEGAAHGLCPKCVFARAMDATGGPAHEPPDLGAVREAFPQLEVLSLIGAGGMGAVFKARQPQLDRFVALKLLAFDHADDARFAERFQREAQALARLSHPNIVTIHDFGKAGGFYYLVMEYVDGVNLRQATAAGRLSPEQALAIVPPICDALQYAHERGIVHRDIKPENLLMDREGRLKIADFGIARILGARERTAGEAGGRGDLTQAGALGTPSYMAPEQKLAPQQVDRRVDIYSLGVVFYEMLTGELPSTPLQPPSRKVQVDVRLDEVVLRALEREPELRFQTAMEFQQTLAEVAGAESGRTAAGKRGVEVGEPQGLSGYAMQSITIAAFAVLTMLLWWRLRGIEVARDWASWPAILVFVGVNLVIAMALFWKRPHHAKKLISAVVGIVLGVGLLQGFRGAWTSRETMWSLPHSPAHYSTDDSGAYVVQEPERVHYVLFAREGLVRSSTSGGFDPKTRVWHDEGAVVINNGWTFGFRRESADPGRVRVNGIEFDLEKGRVILLQPTGVPRQLALYPEPLQKEDLPGLKQKVEALLAADSARGVAQAGETDEADWEPVIRAAKEKLANTTARVQVGVATPLDVSSAQRDLAVAIAESKGDTLAAAEAELSYAKKVLEITRVRYESGFASRAAVLEAEATVGKAQAQFRRAGGKE